MKLRLFVLAKAFKVLVESQEFIKSYSKAKLGT